MKNQLTDLDPHPFKQNGKVWFTVNRKQHCVKIYTKPFSNHPIEYINFKGKQYQVNTVKETEQ
ncbi:hypothetical protein [Acinetobacter baumannii]|uniref:hypothetical protein n=1 Tax=Acinetobacter baumannii TaxID=470 RepID=UPI00367156D0